MSPQRLLLLQQTAHLAVEVTELIVLQAKHGQMAILLQAIAERRRTDGVQVVEGRHQAQDFFRSLQGFALLERGQQPADL